MRSRKVEEKLGPGQNKVQGWGKKGSICKDSYGHGCTGTGEK